MSEGLQLEEFATENQELESLKEAGIAILIDLAQRGEIDPWDVQVIDVIDRFLSKLILPTGGEPGQHDANLSESGQAFLWASMLVLLKAETLERMQAPEESLEATEAELEEENSGNSRLPANLERRLRRRLAAQPLQRRPVTLQELIEQLQQMTAVLENKPVRTRTKRPRQQSATQAARAIAQLAHDENLTEIAGELESFLTAHRLELSPEQDWLDLEQLIKLVSAAKGVEPQPHDRVGVFWALLLLSAQSKVELSQEEFYQEIKIRILEGG